MRNCSRAGQRFPDLQEPYLVSGNMSAFVRTSQCSRRIYTGDLQRRVSNTKRPKQINVHVTRPQGSRHKAAAKVIEKSYVICDGAHFTNSCEVFNKLTPLQRLDLCKKEKKCENCLRKNHRVEECSSTGRCYVCQQRHHTKLHVDMEIHGSSNSNSTSGTNTRHTTNDAQVVVHTTTVHAARLLATAQIILMTPHGQKISVRALDQVAQSLALPRHRLSLYVLAE